MRLPDETQDFRQRILAVLHCMIKILVIEDNREVRENTAELLELNQFLVVTAENGQIGFEKAITCRPDIILCDMMMPETDGRAFLALAKQDERVRQIPLVFFSAGTVNPKAQKKLVSAANGFIKRPFTTEELLHVIHHALQERA